MTTSPPFHHATQTGTHAHLASCGQAGAGLPFWATWQRACSYCLSAWSSRVYTVKAVLPSESHADWLAQWALNVFDQEVTAGAAHKDARLRAMKVLLGIFREASKK